MVKRLARRVLFAFLCTFVAARVTVFLIMSHRIPDIYVHLGGSHVHHLNLGIFILVGVGAWLLFARTAEEPLLVAASFYGVGLALTFDEFGMWLHLGGSYWQRASWDAIVVLTAAIALPAFAPSIRQFRPKHWWSVVIIIAALSVFFTLLWESLGYAERIIAPELLRIESQQPP